MFLCESLGGIKGRSLAGPLPSPLGMLRKCGFALALLGCVHVSGSLSLITLIPRVGLGSSRSSPDFLPWKGHGISKPWVWRGSNSLPIPKVHFQVPCMLNCPGAPLPPMSTSSVKFPPSAQADAHDALIKAVRHRKTMESHHSSCDCGWWPTASE